MTTKTTDKLGDGLAAFQKALPKIAKGNTADAGTYKFKYADLADISAAVLPLLGEHGLSFSARPTLDEGGRFVLAYELLHVSGESRTGAYPLPPSGSPQQIGSAITYARRYALCAVTGVAADEDDDGQAAKDTHVRPAERHEHSWDQGEQDMLRDAYIAEIEKAASVEEIQKTGAAVRRQVAAREISPATNRAIADAAARKVAELDAQRKETTDAPDQQQQALPV